MKLIVDEMCSCKHKRSEHTDRLGGMARGHGACMVSDCKCNKFTWVAMVEVEEGDDYVGYSDKL